MESSMARFRSSFIVLPALAFAACAGDVTAPQNELQIQANSTTAPGLYLTKRGPAGTSATFSIVANGGALPMGATVTLAACPEDGSTICTGTLVWTPTTNDLVDVTVTETGTTGGTIFDQIAASRTMDGVSTFYSVFAPDAPTITIQMNGNATANVRFKNLPGENFVPGRMTGGGGQLILGDVRVTRGFTIHCDIVLSNNLEINWGGNQWHLDKPLTSAHCIDDPAISPEPPAAPFDTFLGEGVGRFNGVDGYTVQFKFVDSGEPGGANDMASILILAPNGDTVLDVPFDYLDHGNLQAHYDQPHK